MTCIKCKNTINEGVKFCKNCGHDQASTLPITEGAPASNLNIAALVEKFGKKNLMIAGGVVAGVLAIVMIGMLFAKSDKAVVLKAASNTIHGITDEITYYTKEIPILNMFSDIKTDKYQFEFENDDMKLLVQSDFKGKKMNIEPQITSYGMSIGAKIQISDKYITAELDGLLDDMYGISNKTLAEDLKNCSFLDMGDIPNDYKIDVFQLQQKIYDDVRKVVNKNKADLVKGLEIEKLEKQEIRVNGENIKATSYSVVLSANVLEDILVNIGNDLLSEGVFENEELINAVIGSMYLGGTVELEDLYFDYVDVIIDAYETIEDGDLVAYIYKNKIVSLTWEDSGTIATLNLNPKGKILENISVVIEDSNYEQEFEFSLTYEKDVLEGVMEFKNDYGSEKFEIVYDVKEEKDNLVIDMYGDELIFDINSNTKNEVLIGYSDDYNSFSFDCKKGKLDKNWFTQTDDFINILTMDLKDFMDIGSNLLI